MIKCKLCNKDFETQILFSSHLRSKHKVKYKEYYDMFFKTESEGKCLTCGNDTKFDRNKYRDYCSVSCMRRSPIIQEKTRATSVKRHGGVGLESASIKEKAVKTNLTRYGVKNPYSIDRVKKNAHSKEAQQKYKSTMLCRYGVVSPAQIEENKQKLIESAHTAEANKKRMLSTKKTNLDRYGVELNLQRPDVKQSIKENRILRQQEFCTLNDCTSLSDLIAKYGSGWCQSSLEVEYLIDKNVKYIKNSEISKIENYASTNIKSHAEEQLFNYIKEIYSRNVVSRSRKIIAPYELDIYIPEKKVAIEYNGIYWHSVNAGTDKNYHLMKTQLCEAQGIKLIHIFQNEWIEHEDICKSIVADALGIYESMIDSKNCIVKEVSTIEAKEFLNKNHIQGYIPFKYGLGLFYKNELVQIITIDNFKILQICTKLHTQVTDGLSKLLKYQPYEKLDFYVDRSKFFNTDCFRFESYTEPSCFYWPSKTAYQLYDCGKIKLSYSK